jgi:hypothetical protein
MMLVTRKADPMSGSVPAARSRISATYSVVFAITCSQVGEGQ